MISRRRQITFGIGISAFAPALAFSQSEPNSRHVGILIGNASDIGQTYVTAIREELARLGWIEEKNIRFTIRWGDGNLGTIQQQLDAILKRKPEIIAVSTATALREVQRSAAGVPVVFWAVSDPVKNRFVQDLARPGGNITGFSLFDYEMGGKWLQLLKEVAPHVSRVCVLMNATNPNWSGWVTALEKHGAALKLELIRPNVTDATHIEPALQSLERESHTGLLALPDPFLAQFRAQILKLALRFKLPAVYGQGYYTDEGGLLSYSIDQVDMARRAAGYVSRILKGEKPGSLPVQSPTKFVLSVNMKTAKALNLKVPQSILLRAEKVIE